MIALLCPGQGSQTPGMLAAWLELPGAGDLAAALSDAAQVDVVRHGTISDADTIRDTAIAQPLLVAAAVISWRALTNTLGCSADAVPATSLPADVSPALAALPTTERLVAAGHSVGELAALVVAGVLDAATAARLVGVRGRAMAHAAATGQPTGMSAVIGPDQSATLEAIEAAGLTAANINGAGQVVAAGPRAALEAFASGNLPTRTRVIALPVAGAFHTAAMASALEEFAQTAASAATHPALMPVVSNLDGSLLDPDALTRTDILGRLTAQIVAPVRWDLCQETFARSGVNTVIELAPAGVLTGLARRTLPDVTRVAITSPDDVAAAREVLA